MGLMGVILRTDLGVCVCLGVCLGVHCMCMDTSLCPVLAYVRVLYLPNFYDRRNRRLGGKKRKT